MLVSVAPSSASAVAMSMPATLRDAENRARLARHVSWRFERVQLFLFRQLNGVARRLGGVLPPRRSRPAERPVRELVHVPARVLLEPVVAPALRAAITQACPA